MSSAAHSLATLLKRTDIEDHEEVLKAANSARKQSKSDTDAQHAKVVALLKLDRYEDAVGAVEAAGEKLKDRVRLEYAYALYKAGKAAEAADIAREGVDRGHKHVEAQARYRTEDFERAAELYEQLSSDLQNDADADLRVNSGAVDAQLEWSGHGEAVKRKKPSREDLEAFETAYNAACGSIARGELGQGEVLLRRAKDLCNALEDMVEEDKQAELMPIAVQHIYVLAKLGRLEEAAELAQSIDTQSVADQSTRHIAKVNSVAASTSPSNPFSAQRLLSKDLDLLKPDYPFDFQTSILRQNGYAADLQSLKYGGTAKSTAGEISKQPSPTSDALTNGLSATNAAAHAKGTTGKEALKHILPLLEKRPNDVGLILTIVQLYVLTGNSESAVTLLENFLSRLEESGSASELDVRFAPGLVGAIVGLYSSRNRRKSAQAELAKAAVHWRRKSKDRPTGVIHLLKAAGSALIESQDSEHEALAKDIFNDLHDQDSNDRYAAAGLLAVSQQAATSEQTSSLESIDRLIAGIDVDALENAGIAQPPNAAGPAVTTRKRPAEDTKPKRTKKIRKSRMPKDYDPNKKPDPERWLPLRDRSTYRPKGKKGKARANLLSQGAAPAGDSDGSRPSTPSGQVVQQKQQGGAAGKKKKGKGKQW